jgi:hypothetical protein
LSDPDLLDADGEPPVETEDFGNGDGRYVIRFPDGEDAEMTWVNAGEGEISIDHTFTPPSRRGGGIAFRMMEKAIADARASGVKIFPGCPYVAAQFKRHPEWADVRAPD